jgi:DNA invertase Pin-like site-specific DNA recombinase
MAQSVDSETPAKGYALGYIRVSTDRQAKADLSMPDQEAAIRQFARQIGLEVGAIYQDSMSGTRADRPGLMAMLDAVDTAKARPVAIIVHSLSRIFRDAVELGLLVRTWKKKKVNLLSVTQEFGEGEAAELMLGIVALFDQHQSLETAKHVRRTMVQSAREGYWNGATAPYGYKTVSAGEKGGRQKKVLAIDPVEAEIVRDIFDLRLSGLGDGSTLGVKRIVEHLNAAGIRTRGGALWGVGAIHQILTRTTYVGRHGGIAPEEHVRHDRQRPCRHVG